jgi:hypothetical protein
MTRTTNLPKAQRNRFFALFAALAVLACANPAQAKKYKLTNKELDQVVAGGLSTQVVQNVTNFNFQGSAGSNQTVDAQGSIQVKKLADASQTAGSLLIQDSAQQNLRSLVNINAVNSKIQVLINMNVNINSTVGTLRQINLTGKY